MALQWVPPPLWLRLPVPLAISGQGLHQPWVLELGIHVRFIPAVAGWPLLMLTLCYNLQGHLQLALWGKGDVVRDTKAQHRGLERSQARTDVKVTL